MPIVRLLWFVTLGWMGAFVAYAVGLLLCCTIIGIPAGILCFQFGNRWLSLRF
jgi:uncharacterized membrane protein YccF (DUF307 family)